jgi:putative flippase GtrA
MNVFRRWDIINAVILGEIVAVFLLTTLKNLEHEIPILTYKFKWLILFLIPVLITVWVYATFHLREKWLGFFQFGKFISVGLSNTSIDFGILNLLIFLTDVERGYLYSLFKAFSFIASVMNSYLWNKFWTFESPETKGMGMQFFQFVLISGVGFGLNVVVASFVVNVVQPVGEISPRLWANVGAFAAIVISVFWNFLGYKFIVFKK